MKYVYICDCRRGGVKVRGESFYQLVDVDKDQYCLLCRHAAYAKWVPDNWLPEWGFIKEGWNSYLKDLNKQRDMTSISLNMES